MAQTGQVLTKNIPHKPLNSGHFPVAQDAVINHARFIVKNTAGFGKEFTAVASETLVGVSFSSVNNAGMADGDQIVRVERAGLFKCKIDSVVATDVGTLVYVEEAEGKVTKSVLITKAGIIQSVENDLSHVWVDIYLAVAVPALLT